MNIFVVIIYADAVLHKAASKFCSSAFLCNKTLLLSVYKLHNLILRIFHSSSSMNRNWNYNSVRLFSPDFFCSLNCTVKRTVNINFIEEHNARLFKQTV